MTDKIGVFITGGSGLLALNWALSIRDRYAVTLGIHERKISLDGVDTCHCVLESVDAIQRVFGEIQPALVIHAAGLTSVEGCESNPKDASNANIKLAENVARACSILGISLVHISTDHLFAGDMAMIDERQPVTPINIYGRTKADAESRVMDIYPETLIVRTNFFGWGSAYRSSFSDVIIESLRSEKELTLFKDVFFTPIHISTLASAVHDLVALKASGIHHVVGDERISKYDFGIKVAEYFKLDKSLIKPGLLKDCARLVQRPLDMSLSNNKTCKVLDRKLGGVDENLTYLFQQELYGLDQEIKGQDEIIPYGRHYIDEDDVQAVVDILRSGYLTQGPTVELFERELAKYVGAKYAVAVSTGTSALHLAALVAGVGPGSSLITSPMTFIASANAALYAGGEPLFVDIDPDTINMSLSSLRDVISSSSNVRAIVPVHFAGLSCDMPAIKEQADEIGAVVIEDAAHALGGQYPDGTRIGCCANSHMTIFSFHPVKAIAAGEGGAITTNDEKTYHRLLRLRSHGINKLDDTFQLPDQAFEKDMANPWYYEMQELGYNYRITDIQCGLALSQLKKLGRYIERRRELVDVYDKAFSKFNNCYPAQSTGRDISGHHLYVLRIDYKSVGLTRAQLIQELRRHQILCQVHYIPVPSHPYYRNLGFNPNDYPNAQNYYQEALSIPLFYELKDEQQGYIISVLKSLVS